MSHTEIYEVCTFELPATVLLSPLHFVLLLSRASEPAEFFKIARNDCGKLQTLLMLGFVMMSECIS